MPGLTTLALSVCLAIEPAPVAAPTPGGPPRVERASPPVAPRQAAVVLRQAAVAPRPRALARRVPREVRRRATTRRSDVVLALPMFVPLLLPLVVLLPPRRLDDPSRARRATGAAGVPSRSDP
jgi:hypothetical protein